MYPSRMTGMEAVQMTRVTTADQWLTSKYGGPVQVWKCEINMKNMGGDSEG